MLPHIEELKYLTEKLKRSEYLVWSLFCTRGSPNHFVWPKIRRLPTLPWRGSRKLMVQGTLLHKWTSSSSWEDEEVRLVEGTWWRSRSSRGLSGSIYKQSRVHAIRVLTIWLCTKNFFCISLVGTRRSRQVPSIVQAFCQSIELIGNVGRRKVQMQGHFGNKRRWSGEVHQYSLSWGKSSWSTD